MVELSIYMERKMEYIEKIVNADGSVIERPYSDEEIKEAEKRFKEIKANDAKLLLKQTQRQAAIDKLLNLGLNENDLKALGLA